MAEKFSVHRLVSATLLPRLKAGAHIRLREFAEELFDECADDFAVVARDLAINQVIAIGRKLMSDAVNLRQGAFDFDDLPTALAVPIGGAHEFEYVAIEHALRREGRAALSYLIDQRTRFQERIRAIERFIFTAEARGCPDEGILFDYLNGHHGPPSSPEYPDHPTP